MNRLKIKVLMDDESLDERFEKEHGLSLLIEHQLGSVLFDTGKTGAFIDNARLMNADLSKVKHVVLSHGHYDHTGGLKTFLEFNRHAKIYFQINGSKQRFSQKEDGKVSYIGVGEDFPSGSRVTYTDTLFKINESMTLFSGVEGKHFVPSLNKSLFQQTDQGFERDDFSDEQNLIIQENGKIALISGCSHKGILNIIDKAEEILHKPIDVVIGGFHLFNFTRHLMEDEKNIQSIIDYFQNRKTKIYVMHCTGTQPYDILKKALQNRIEYKAAGTEIFL